VANLQVKDAQGDVIDVKATGAGSVGDPAVPHHIVDSIATALPAGTNNIGDVDIASALPAGDNNIGNVDVVTAPGVYAEAATTDPANGVVILHRTSARGLRPASDTDPLAVDGGSPALAAASDALGTDAHLTAALDESPVVAVKASSGRIYGYHLYNSHATDEVYVQFFDVAAGSVTVGTTTPSRVRAIPPGACLDAILAVPWTFGTAISMAATATATGAGAPAAAVVASLEYK
jgi:hypothetical protein